MRLLTIQAKNFRLLADIEVTLPATGVTGIIGLNESGKSTLVTELVLWVLYGGVAIIGTMAGLRWKRAPARHVAAGVVRFELKGVTYRVERDENNARVYDESADKMICEGTTPVNEFIPRLTGRSYNETVTSIVVTQKDVARIATMKPTERQTFIREVLGVGRLDSALKACRSEKNALAERLVGLTAGLGEREPLAAMLQVAEGEVIDGEPLVESSTADHEQATVDVATAETSLADYVEVKARHDKASADLMAADERLAATISAEVKCGEQLHGAKTARDRMETAAVELGALPALRTERDVLRDARAAENETATLNSRIAAMGKELATLTDGAERSRAKLSVQDPTIVAAAADTLARESDRFAKMRDDRIAARQEQLAVAALHTNYARTQAVRLTTMREAGEDGACPTCARALGGQYDAVIADLESQRSEAETVVRQAEASALSLEESSDEEVEAEVAVDAAGEELKRLVAEEQKATEAARELRGLEERSAKVRTEIEADRLRLSELPEAQYDAARMTEVEAETKRLEELDESLVHVRAQASRIKELEEQVDVEARTTEERAKAKAEAEAALSDAPYDKDRHGAIQEVRDRYLTAVRLALVAMTKAQTELDGARKAVTVADEALSAYDARSQKLEEMQAEHLVCERTAARLADFRTAVASTIRPELEELMSGFIQRLTDGRHEAVTLDEDFSAVLMESGVPMEVVSGGCQDIAALAMRLAISQMISQRAGHALSLLVLDEPFGSLDDSRRDNVLALIRSLSTTFEQVLIISHIAETKDAVDHVIELEFVESEGMTRVMA